MENRLKEQEKKPVFLKVSNPWEMIGYLEENLRAIAAGETYGTPAKKYAKNALERFQKHYKTQLS